MIKISCGRNIITILIYFILLLNFTTCKFIFRDESSKYTTNIINNVYPTLINCKYMLEWYMYDTEYEIVSFQSNNNLIQSNSRLISGVYQFKTTSEVLISSSNQTTLLVTFILSNSEKQTVTYDLKCLQIPTSYEIIPISLPAKAYSNNEFSSQVSVFFKFKNESIIPFFPDSVIGVATLSTSRYIILGLNLIKYSLKFSNSVNRYQELTMNFNNNSIQFQPPFASTKYQDLALFKNSLKYYPSTAESYYNIISTFNMSYPSGSNSSGLFIYGSYENGITIYPIYDTPTERVFLTLFDYASFPATLSFTFGPSSSQDTKILLDKSAYSLVYYSILFSISSQFSTHDIYNSSSTNFVVLYIKASLIPDPLFVDYNSLASISMTFEYPFGYKGLLSDRSSYLLSVAALVSKNSRGVYSYRLGLNGSSKESQSFYPGEYDPLVASLVSIKSYDIGSMNVVLELQIVSLKTGFAYCTQDEKILLDTSKLVAGTIFNGTYQIVYDYGFKKTTTNNCIVSNSRVNNCMDSIVRPFISDDKQKVLMVDLPITRSMTIMDIKYYYFALNNVDTTNRGVYNSLFFKFKQDNNPDYKIKFKLQISEWYQNPIDYYSHWDSKYQVYRVDFYLPANLIRMNIQYSITFGNDQNNAFTNDYFSTLFGDDNATLSVYSNNGDIMPPMIKNITLPPSSSGLEKLEWKFEIEDPINGFDYGQVVIRGSVDQIRYKFQLDSRDSSNIYSDVYIVSFRISDQMISQIFDIEYIKLVDRSGHYSEYKYGVQLPKVVNPLASLLYNLNLFRYNFTNSQSASQDSPTIGGVVISPDSINSDSDRSINITFLAICQFTPVLISQDALPVIYIGLNTNLEYLKFPIGPNDIVNTFNDGKSVTLSRMVDIPYGYGLTDGLTLNIFGVQCESSSFIGFSANDLRLINQPYMIKVNNYLSNTPAIESSSTISRDGGLLTIYGRNLYATGVNSKFRLDYNQLVLYDSKPKVAIGSVAVIEINQTITSDFIKVSFTNDGQSYTSTLTIQPLDNYWVDIKPWYTETTLPPIPQPIKCLGTPLICGGPSKGNCTNENGCVCIYPWSGLDCSSLISNDYQVENNQTVPSSNYSVTQGTIKYNGDISIIGIKELDVSNKLVKYYDLTTQVIWEYYSGSGGDSGSGSTDQDQINNTYIGNITSSSDNINSITTFINITVQYFKKQTQIEFAGYNLTQSPSTFKYTISISKYGFKSTLNSLQLVLKSSLESTGDNSVCSSTDYIIGSSNIMKLQIKDITFYSRYINRAIVDNSIVSISNDLLSDNYSVKNNSNSLVKSYIGINIPNYSNSVLLDPDFSVLLESKSANINSNNSNCPNLSSKLTKSQLAGIIVGSFIGLVIIILAGLLVLSKFKYKSDNLMKLHLIFRKNIKL